MTIKSIIFVTTIKNANMNKNQFIENFRNAFGNYELPIVFGYSEHPMVVLNKTRGCFIKDLKPAREGGTISLNLDTISCSGGKTYTGFMALPPYIPNFVSLKERYKETPEMVADFIKDMNMLDKEGLFINFTSIKNIENFDNIEGVLFFATPDVLAGLVSWALFDTNVPEAVSVPFGSGCSSLISQTVIENKQNGHRVFLGLFDPSVRPHVETNILSLAIPLSRFKKMYYTFEKSCLADSHAWTKVRERITENEFRDHN
jgi:hypothetical protein